MKKDKEWAFIELGKLSPSHAEMYDFPDDMTVMKCELLNKVYDILSQLEESETIEQTALLLENALKENKRLGKLLEEKHEEWLELMDEINNQEKLSQDWIVDNVSFIQAGRGYVLGSRLKNLIVPKLELPTIPKFIAEVIEEDKECGYDVYESIDLILGTNGGGLPSISDWVARNIDKYARAWLNGFTVEGEPLYRAKLKVITDEFIASYLRTQSSDAEDRLKALEIGSKYIHEDYRHLSEFTEDELKKLNIWNSEQWEIEEVEE